MITVQILEPDDTILPTDWCRPLALVTMSGGQSDYYSFKNTYGGSPENNVEWVRVDAILGECWFGSTVKKYQRAVKARYEFVRGDVPKSHRLSMKGYSDHAKTIKKLKKLTASRNDWAEEEINDDIPF